MHFVDHHYQELTWALAQVRNEIAVLKRVSMGHQNILTLVDYFETMNNCVFIPMALRERRRLILALECSIFGD